MNNLGAKVLFFKSLMLTRDFPSLGKQAIMSQALRKNCTGYNVSLDPGGLSSLWMMPRHVRPQNSRTLRLPVFSKLNDPKECMWGFSPTHPEIPRNVSNFYLEETLRNSLDPWHLETGSRGVPKLGAGSHMAAHKDDHVVGYTRYPTLFWKPIKVKQIAFLLQTPAEWGVDQDAN